MKILLDDNVTLLTRHLLGTVGLVATFCADVGRKEARSGPSQADTLLTRMCKGREQGFDVYVTSSQADIQRAATAFGGEQHLPIRLEHVLNDPSYEKTFASTELLAGRLEQIRQQMAASPQIYKVSQNQWRIAGTFNVLDDSGQRVPERLQTVASAQKQPAQQQTAIKVVLDDNVSWEIKDELEVRRYDVTSWRETGIRHSWGDKSSSEWVSDLILSRLC